MNPYTHTPPPHAAPAPLALHLPKVVHLHATQDMQDPLASIANSIATSVSEKTASVPLTPNCQPATSIMATAIRTAIPFFDFLIHFIMILLRLSKTLI
jgi:hypothetical protein